MCISNNNMTRRRNTEDKELNTTKSIMSTGNIWNCVHEETAQELADKKLAKGRQWNTLESAQTIFWLPLLPFKNKLINVTLESSGILGGGFLENQQELRFFQLPEPYSWLVFSLFLLVFILHSADFVCCQALQLRILEETTQNIAKE